MHAKHVGNVVAIVYLDRRGSITQRRIRVIAIQDGQVKAYDMEKRGPRVFRADRILACFPDKRTA